jgi:hypothetical protein
LATLVLFDVVWHTCSNRHMSGASLPTDDAMARRDRHQALYTLLVALAVFGSLWALNMPYRQAYVPTMDDVTALADGLLLRPGAHWQDWFTRGHTDFFDAYPEWPNHEQGFARPAFQFLIYLAHFALGRDWASYLSLNYLGLAGVAALAFAIARTALGLGNAASVFAAALVLTSSAVLEFSTGVLGVASESFATMLVGGAFLAVLTRRDMLCFALLMVALFTKETAAWAPLAAALTVLVRRERARREEAPRRRMLAAGAMLLPLALWLGFRIVFYGGIGGTYATAGYTPVSGFLALTARKLIHLHHLFVMQDVALLEENRALLERAIGIGTALLVFVLLFAWVVTGVRAAWDSLGQAVREKGWPSVDSPLLVGLWAVLGLASYFVLAISSPRYAASAVLFVWPAVVGEALSRRSAWLRASLAACLVLSLIRTSHLLSHLNPPSEASDAGQFFRAGAALNAALSEVPPHVKQVYVISAGGLVLVRPDYLRALVGTSAEIIRLVDVSWHCDAVPDKRIAFDHGSLEGIATLSATLPDCASFEFYYSGLEGGSLVNGRLSRNGSISYELPEATIVDRGGELNPRLEPGRRLVAHVRLDGPVRFIIERASPDGGLTWFDTP